MTIPYQLIAWSIEWEGSISISKYLNKERGTYSYAPKVGIGNTNLDRLQAFQRLVKIGHVNINGKKSQYSKGRKRCYSWDLSTAEMREHLLSIQPHLVEKDQQGLLVIRLLTILKPRVDIRQSFYEIYSQQEASEMDFLYQQCCLLNRKGE